MPSPELNTIIILSEIVIIETVLIISFLVYLFFKSKKKSLKLNSLLKSFIADEKNRLNSLLSTFNKPEFLSEEQYNTILKNIITTENSFYNHLMTIFYKNDLDILSSIPLEIQKISKPCVEFISVNEKENINEMVNKEPGINVDDAIDGLLSDNSDTENETDPEFDLSESKETIIETPVDEIIRTNIENDEITEIPSDLLNNIDLTVEDATESEHISKNKPEK